MSTLAPEERREFVRAVRDLLGSGYVDDYYESMASEFISVGEWLLDKRQRESTMTTTDPNVVSDLTEALLKMLAQHLREEPGEPNGNMPVAMQDEQARAHADWAERGRAMRLLCGWRLVKEALEALDG